MPREPFGCLAPICGCVKLVLGGGPQHLHHSFSTELTAGKVSSMGKSTNLSSSETVARRERDAIMERVANRKTDGIIKPDASFCFVKFLNFMTTLFSYPTVPFSWDESSKGVVWRLLFARLVEDRIETYGDRVETCGAFDEK